LKTMKVGMKKEKNGDSSLLVLAGLTTFSLRFFCLGLFLFACVARALRLFFFVRKPY